MRAAPNVAQGTINIKNAQAYYTQGDSNSVAWEDVGIKVVDDLTFEIHYRAEIFSAGSDGVSPFPSTLARFG